jgi:hypothetical protein
MDTLEPLDELMDDCIEYLKSIGSNSTRVSQIIENQDLKVYEAIEKGSIFNCFFLRQKREEMQLFFFQE